MVVYTTGLKIWLYLYQTYMSLYLTYAYMIRLKKYFCCSFLGNKCLMLRRAISISYLDMYRIFKYFILIVLTVFLFILLLSAIERFKCVIALFFWNTGIAIYATIHFWVISIFWKPNFGYALVIFNDGVIWTNNWISWESGTRLSSHAVVKNADRGKNWYQGGWKRQNKC